jgi:hypothetical protein
VVIRQTILQLKTQITWGRSCCKFNFVGSSNELGAFKRFTAKLMGTVSAVVFGGSMTLITVLTGVLSPTFRKLDLQQDVEDHEKSE